MNDSAAPEDARTGLSADAIQRGFLQNLFFCRAKFPEVATRNDNYLALALTVRDRLLHRWVHTARSYLERESRTVIYLSAEYLLGPHLGNNLVNLGIEAPVREALAGLGLDLDDLLEQEEEPGLGNGGLGRLAACFMDSMATLAVPAIGYGIRYEFGIFDQELRDGWQVEVTDKWLRYGNPWEIENLEIVHEVHLGGRTRGWTDEEGQYRVEWLPAHTLRGVAYDTPVLGYGVDNANFLRLWKAQAAESFDLATFNTGDHYGAVEEKVVSENVSKVLYPNDEPLAGKELRLAQQYFFVSCSLQDMLRIYRMRRKDLGALAEKFVVQLNDTHPSLAVAEMMRLLVDVYGEGWDEAWRITRGLFAYTNHTLLPEALETWPLPLFQRLLPRHLEIVFEINRRFLDELRAAYPGDEDRVRRMSLIDERGERAVRMANLACVGSHAINGVAELHTELLRRTVLEDFHEHEPDKIQNVTNGVTPRRFVVLANPGLTRLVSERIGREWIADLERLRALEPLAGDAGFQEQWRAVKLANKRALAAQLAARSGVTADPSSLFDVLVKRIHEYKRQHLCALYVLSRWQRLLAGEDLPPRTFVFGGKAAPSYRLAKLIIKLITSIGDRINEDARTRDRLQVAFFPDFNVKNAQSIYPAAEVSEQISLAGKEASGTGNMKFAMNGALTVGTLDGANVEIRAAVGEENFFLFGLHAGQVLALKDQGYRPREEVARSAALRAALEYVAGGGLSPSERDRFRPLVDGLLDHDPYLVLTDFADYAAAQDRVDEVWRDPAEWTRMSILNSARSGRFSSDRSIRDYCARIWKVSPARVRVPEDGPLG
ncbi:MAG: glycogen/starch/alpha-glucan phosphorylase [Planctomycetota bacterium]